MVLALFRKITLGGVRKYPNPEMMRRVTLINQYTWITTVFAVVGLIENWLMGHNDIVPYIAVTASVYIGSIFMINRGFAISAVFFQTCADCVTILAANLMYDVGGLGFLYYFPMVIAQVFLLNSEDTRKYMYLNFGVTALSAASSMLLLNNGIHIEIHLSGEMIREMASFNTIGSAALTIAILLLYVDFNRKGEKRLEKIIKDRELLLAEVHHRVKNNLAIISGLLNMQKNLLTDKSMQQVLEDSRSRVSSMALIHDRLYKNKSFSAIDFDSYVANLLDEIDRGYGMKKKVERFLKVSNVHLDINSSIPCGLILNELFTNSYKHAFKNVEGKVSLEISQDGQKVHLHYSDNGPGVTDIDKIHESESLGVTIITSLVDQLDGTYSFYNESGLHFKMDFELKRKGNA